MSHLQTSPLGSLEEFKEESSDPLIEPLESKSDYRFAKLVKKIDLTGFGRIRTKIDFQDVNDF